VCMSVVCVCEWCVCVNAKVYKLKMQGKYPESSELYVEPEVEKKEKPKVEKEDDEEKSE